MHILQRSMALFRWAIILTIRAILHGFTFVVRVNGEILVMIEARDSTHTCVFDLHHLDGVWKLMTRVASRAVIQFGLDIPRMKTGICEACSNSKVPNKSNARIFEHLDRLVVSRKTSTSQSLGLHPYKKCLFLNLVQSVAYWSK